MSVQRTARATAEGCGLGNRLPEGSSRRHDDEENRDAVQEQRRNVPAEDSSLQCCGHEIERVAADLVTLRSQCGQPSAEQRKQQGQEQQRKTVEVQRKGPVRCPACTPAALQRRSG